MVIHEMRSHLQLVPWGEHGLTRNDIRQAWPQMPDELYLRLPDSKRYVSVDDVLHEAQHSFARAEGEFTAADDDTPPEGATGDGGPPAWGADPLRSDTANVLEGGSRPLPEG